MMIKLREEVIKEKAKVRSHRVIADYMDRDDDGEFRYTVKEVAERNGISVPMVYKIIKRYEISRK